MKILIVEDNFGKLQKIRKILDKYELKYDVVSTGKDALRVLEEHQYEILILDICFPWQENEIAKNNGIKIMEIQNIPKTIVYSDVPVEKIWEKEGKNQPDCFIMQAVFPFQLEAIIRKCCLK